MNELILTYRNGGTAAHPEAGAPSEPMPVLQPRAVNPSDDLAIVAKALAHKMPRQVRLGSPRAS